jgi:hypothetical protein
MNLQAGHSFPAVLEPRPSYCHCDARADPRGSNLGPLGPLALGIASSREPLLATTGWRRHRERSDPRGGKGRIRGPGAARFSAPTRCCHLRLSDILRPGAPAANLQLVSSLGCNGSKCGQTVGLTGVGPGWLRASPAVYPSPHRPYAIFALAAPHRVPRSA